MGSTLWANLDAALVRALRPVRAVASDKVVLFSGGVDSGLLAWELRDAPGTSLFTAGVAGAADLAAAARAAPLLGLPWTARVVPAAELEGLLARLGPELAGVPGPRRGIAVALAAAISAAPPGLLLCGQGADELFLGYAHYRGLTAEEAGRRSALDLEQLLQDDWPRSCRIASLLGRELAAPYLDPAFVGAATAIPVDQRLPGELTKPLLRRWSRSRGLPGPIAEVPKRAIQYGSGVDRWLRRRATALAGRGGPRPP